MFKLLSLLLLFAFLNVTAQKPAPGNSKNNSSEIQKEITELKKDIKELEEEIKQAQDDPEELADLKKELALLKQALQMLEGNKPALLAFEKNYDPAKEENVKLFDVPAPAREKLSGIPELRKQAINMPGFCKETNRLVGNSLPEKTTSLGKSLFTHYKDTEKMPEDDLANTGVKFWMMGLPDLGMFFMGLAFMNEPSNANAQCNYAAMLSMSGFSDRAVVMLEDLNKKYPNNTTILNNLGQAWFNLGEKKEAEYHFRKTLGIHKNHPEANLTMACLLVEQGKKQEAIECIKNSLEESYNEVKIDMLEELGEKNLKKEKYWRAARPKADFLGLRKYYDLIPEYPYNTADAKIWEQHWEAYYQMLDNEMERLAEEKEAFEEVRNKANEQFVQDQISLKKRFSPIAKQFIRLRYDSFIEPYLTGNKMREFGQKLSASAEISATNNEELRLLLEKFGKEKLSESAMLRLQDDFLASANERWSKFQDHSMLEYVASYFDSVGYIFQFYITPNEETYKWYIYEVRMAFLGFLRSLQFQPTHPMFAPGIQKPPKHRGLNIPFFEHPVCRQGGDLNLWIGEIKTNCNSITASLKIPVHKNVAFDGSYSEDFNTGKWKGSVGVEVSLDAIELKIPATMIPQKLSIKPAVGMGMEFGSDGLSDVYMTVGMKSSVKDDLGLPGDHNLGSNILTQKNKFSLMAGNGNLVKAETKYLQPKIGFVTLPSPLLLLQSPKDKK